MRLFGLAPNRRRFYGLLGEAGDNIERATQLLDRLMRNWPEDDGLRREIVECEHTGDRITHDVIHRIYQTSVTPLDREDIFSLASALDDVVDYTEEASDFLYLYQIEAPMEQALGLTGVLRDAGRAIAEALRRLGAVEELNPHLVEINRLENEGDRIVREALASLFAGGIDPIVIIRWKDVFDRLEQAIDSCEHVAHILEGIVVKQA